MGYCESLQGDGDRSAFRKAEKRYKLYKSVRGSITRERVPPTDLSDVVDFRKILDLFDESGTTPPGIVKLEQEQFDRPVFTIAERPGFFFIPGALSMEDQFLWIKESLVTFPQPPNRTNHNAFYGSIHNLWSAVQNQKVLVEAGNLNSVVETDSQSNTIIKGPNGSSWVFMDEKYLKEKKARLGFPLKTIAASVLLRKLRWATLGLQFDWSKAMSIADQIHGLITGCPSPQSFLTRLIFNFYYIDSTVPRNGIEKERLERLFVHVLFFSQSLFLVLLQHIICNICFLGEDVPAFACAFLVCILYLQVIS